MDYDDFRVISLSYFWFFGIKPRFMSSGLRQLSVMLQEAVWYFFVVYLKAMP